MGLTPLLGVRFRQGVRWKEPHAFRIFIRSPHPETCVGPGRHHGLPSPQGHAAQCHLLLLFPHLPFGEENQRIVSFSPTQSHPQW